MSAWLAHSARHVGPASAIGTLYRVADYPGFVAEPGGTVTGDLFALADPQAVLAVLDEHEECSARFPEPHEYRRERITVMGETGPCEAWTYVYAREIAGLARIGNGDFLGRTPCAGPATG
jgi:gamma-glutamylcyclotransferase (GGCT)/AIG2-like uncharacterized protein YtfP